MKNYFLIGISVILLLYFSSPPSAVQTYPKISSVHIPELPVLDQGVRFPVTISKSLSQARREYLTSLEDLQILKARQCNEIEEAKLAIVKLNDKLRNFKSSAHNKSAELTERVNELSIQKELWRKRINWMDRMVTKGYISKVKLETEGYKYTQACFALNQAQRQLSNFENVEIPNTIRDLEAESVQLKVLLEKTSERHEAELSKMNHIVEYNQRSYESRIK